jgi:hypothetical protein
MGWVSLGSSNYMLEWTFFFGFQNPFVFPFYRVWTQDATRKNAGSGDEGGAANTSSTVLQQQGRGLLERPNDHVISTTTHALPLHTSWSSTTRSTPARLLAAFVSHRHGSSSPVHSRSPLWSFLGLGVIDSAKSQCFLLWSPSNRVSPCLVVADGDLYFFSLQVSMLPSCFCGPVQPLHLPIHFVVTWLGFR